MVEKLAAAIVGALLCVPSTVYAHGERPGHIDEGPGPGTLITVIMVVSWIAIAVGVVFFVFRLIRAGGPKRQGEDKQEKT